MASYEGNRLPAPGFFAGTERPPVEILYSEVGLFQKGGTLAVGQGVLTEGTALTYDTTAKTYSASAASDTIEGFLRYAVDTGASGDPAFQAIIVYGGKLVASKLSFDGAALTATTAATTATALNGRYIASRDVLEF